MLSNAYFVCLFLILLGAFLNWIGKGKKTTVQLFCSFWGFAALLYSIGKVIVSAIEKLSVVAK
jgi:hypothetical protein